MQRAPTDLIIFCSVYTMHHVHTVFSVELTPYVGKWTLLHEFQLKERNNGNLSWAADFNYIYS